MLDAIWYFIIDYPLAALAIFHAVASFVCWLTPTPRDDEIYGKLYHVLEVIALNIGHAKEFPPNKGKRR